MLVGEMVRQDSLRLPPAGRADDLFPGNDQVEKEIVRRDRQVLVHQLEWMDGRRRRCLPVDGSHLASDRIFEVGVTASLSDPGAFSVDGNGTRHDQVYVRQFARADGLCQTRGALDRRGGRQIASLEPRGIERKKSGKRASASVFGSRRLTACRMSWLTSRSGLPTRSAS